jgi:citrate lyase synthetase
MREIDLQSVYRLVQETLEISYHAIYPIEAIQFFKEYHQEKNVLKDFQSGYTVVAESGGNILGTGTLLGTNIRRVFIHPAHQGQGMGRSIYHHLEKRAVQNKLPGLDLSSSLKAKEFWESLGFTIFKEFSLPVANGQKLDYFEMIKNLVY